MWNRLARQGQGTRDSGANARTAVPPGNLAFPYVRWPATEGSGTGRAHEAAELSARTDVQLAVDARQVRLDGLGADEQLRGDLAIGHPLGRQLGDPVLRRGQVRAVAQPRAHPAELGARPLGPEACPQPLEGAQRLAERRGRRLLLAPASQQLTVQ